MSAPIDAMRFRFEEGVGIVLSVLAAGDVEVDLLAVSDELGPHPKAVYNLTQFAVMLFATNRVPVVNDVTEEHFSAMRWLRSWLDWADSPDVRVPMKGITAPRPPGTPTDAE